MMRALFSHSLLALVAIIGLATGAQAEALRTICISVLSQSAGSQPFIKRPVDIVLTRHQLEEAFKSQGVEVQWQFFKGASPAANEALADRQLGFVYFDDLATIVGEASGLSTRLLLGSRGLESWSAVTKASDIKAPADLKGKRVAVYRGTTGQLVFSRTLQTAGLDERSLQIIGLDWDAGKTALATDRVDAVWGSVSLLAPRGGRIDVVVESGDSGRQNATQAEFLGTQTFIGT